VAEKKDMIGDVGWVGAPTFGGRAKSDWQGEKRSDGKNILKKKKKKDHGSDLGPSLQYGEVGLGKKRLTHGGWWWSGLIFCRMREP